MTEITMTQKPQNSALATEAPGLGLTDTTVSLMEWAQELDAALRLGTALCGTEFAPASFRGKPEAAAAAIMTGKSLGLDPMNALSNIFVVQGRPAMYARTMVALVLSAGHSVRRGEATNDSVTVYAHRKGESDWQAFTWSIDRAKQAGYLNNKKYASDPIAMLTAKAQAEACRTIAPDVLTGVAAYSAEEVELEDLGEAPVPPAPAKATPKRTVKRKQQPAPELPSVVNTPPAPEEDNDEPLADTHQVAQVRSILKDMGADNATSKTWLSSFTGRDINATKELTITEAQAFIDDNTPPAADENGELIEENN